MSKIYGTELGKHIKTRRLELDLSQNALAKLAGVSQGAISLYESGARQCSDKVRERITTVLGSEPPKTSRNRKKHTRRNRGPNLSRLTPPFSELGKFIRARRLKLGLSQTQLGKLVGVSQAEISRYEIGRSRLNEQTMKNLASALRCELNELCVLQEPTRAQKTMPKTELGKLIYTRREEFGLSLNDLAKRSGLSRNHVRRLEGKTCTHLRTKTAFVLAQTLKISNAELSRFVETREKPTDSKLGKVIREQRHELGLSTDDLAQRIGTTPQFINQVELGLCTLSQSEVVVERIAKALDLDFNKLNAMRPARKLRCKRVEGTLGAFLTFRRQELRMTQREVARRIGVSTSVLTNIETGLTCPNTAMLKKLGKVLDCEIPDNLLNQM